MSLDANLKINTEIVKLEPSQLLELFFLDTTTCIRDPYTTMPTFNYYFHGYNIRPDDSNGITDEDKQNGIIVWQGIKYYYYPLAAEGFELLGDGQMPRPVLRVANVFRIIKDLTLSLGDLVGATLIRRRVFRKFLDYPDGSNPEADSSAGLPNEKYIISRKKTENKFIVEFEMVSPLEAYDVSLPRRQILKRYCSWNYRGDGCEFNKAVIIDKNNNYWGCATSTWGPTQNLSDPTEWQPNVNYSVNDVVFIYVNRAAQYFLCKKAHKSDYTNRYSADYWIADVCNKSLGACKMRFWPQNNTTLTLPFGGFPSVGQT